MLKDRLYYIDVGDEGGEGVEREGGWWW